MSETPPVIYDFDPHNLPPEMLNAIGLVVAASSQTESIVGDFIATILGTDMAEALALTAHMSNPLKDQVARTLVELAAADAKTVDRADDLLDAIKEAQGRRNVIVHNKLARHPETNEVFSYREEARGSTIVKLKPITVDEIEEVASLIYEAGLDLQRFMVNLGLDYPSALKRPLRQPLNRKKKAREARRSGNV